MENRGFGFITSLGTITCVAALLTVSPALAGQTAPQPTKPPTTHGAKPTHPATSASTPKAGANADHQFVMHAASGGAMEVELGRLAAQKGSHAGVKEFGQRMVDDHSKANDELKSIASGKNITLPAESKATHATMAKLEKLNGAAFDSTYVAEMVADHEKDVALFEREAKSGKDPEFKAFAEKTLPTLKEHLTQVRDLKGKLSKHATN